MVFDNPVNNQTKIPFAAPHTSGSSSYVLATSGTQFQAPFRITAIIGATYGGPNESSTILGVWAVSPNTPAAGKCTLTASPIEGTSDQNFGIYDFAEMRFTAGSFAELSTAIADLQSGIYSVPTMAPWATRKPTRATPRSRPAEPRSPARR